MEKAEVYFADMRAYPGKENLLQKLNRLMVKAGIDKIDFKNKFGDNPIYLFRNELKKLTDEKLIIIDNNNIKLTNKGLDLANLVWEEFI